MTGDLLLLASSLPLYIFALVFECHFFPSKLYHYLRLHIGSLYSSTYQLFHSIANTAMSSNSYTNEKGGVPNQRFGDSKAKRNKSDSRAVQD
jgi:hypothetical protein